MEHSIHLLPADVVGQIAAGEVVERPAHLIKELIENSLDAGATEIEIMVRDQAGLEIEVRDNGHGISERDLTLALAPHATSKIAVSDDLWHLSTFGFRGEALASIAAVSILRLSSRTLASDSAYFVTSTFGKNSAVKETSAPVGTHLRIDKLFENVPARLKFLKSKRTEVGLVRQTLKAVALSNEAVGFRFFYNDALEFYYPPGQNFEQRAGLVLQFAPPLGEVNFTSEGWSVNAVLPDVREVAVNFKNFWIFVQNRWIQDRTIQAAVMEAHRSLLMHGEYPQGVLKIVGPTEVIDVNVHPTKSQIRFQNSSDVFRLVHRALRNHLEAAQKLISVGETGNEASPSREPSPYFANLGKKKNFVQAGETLFSSQKSDALFTVTQTQYAQKRDFSTATNAASVAKEVSQSSTSPSVNSADTSGSTAEAKQGFWAGHQVLAQLKSTYLIVQGQDGCVLIDQHAAHERILYERILRHIAEGRYSSQVELLPYLIELTPEQIEFLVGHSNEFAKWGLHIEEFGPRSLVIKESLSFLRIEQVAKSLKELAANHAEYQGSDSFQQLIHDFAAMTACHSAIRAGDVLEFRRMHELLHEMDECPFSHFCPHGRPVFIQWSWRKLEQEFGRIV